MLAMISPTKVSAVEENLLPFEHITVYLDCDKAQLTVACGIQPGNNTEIVHFPSSVNVLALFDVGCTRLYTIFGKKSSVLVFEFNNIGSSEAKARSDQWAQLIETAFDTTFTWQYTNTSSTYVYVRYTNSGATNATIYSCLRQCLNWTYGAEKPLGGFSDAIHGELTRFAEYTDYSVSVGARKGSWGEYAKSVDMGLTVSYTQKMANGTGSHTIDVLSLLGVTSLAPSRYALDNAGMYSSTVFLTINSSTPVTFVSCEPSPLNPPGIRGWYSTPSTSNRIDAQFQFKGDNSSVSPLTFTFTGTIIPETGNLSVSFSTSPTIINGGQTSTLKILVTNGTTAITGATITLTSDKGGSFSAVTDHANGTYSATFTASNPDIQTNCTINATVSKSGYGTISTQTQVTVQPKAPPSAVTLSTPTQNEISASSIVLRWTESSNNDFLKYEVYMSSSSTQLGSLVTTINTKTTTTFTVLNLSPSTTYYFAVRAYNTENDYADSTKLTITSAAEIPFYQQPILIGAIIITVVVAIAAFALMMRKKIKF
jgi:hypothetical protein